MQLEECCETSVGSDIDCFIPYKVSQYSFTDHNFDLALKLRNKITK